MVSALLADIILLRFFAAHTLPYKNSVLGLQDFFGLLNPEDGTNRLPRNVGKKLPLLAV